MKHKLFILESAAIGVLGAMAILGTTGVIVATLILATIAAVQFVGWWAAVAFWTVLILLAVRVGIGFYRSYRWLNGRS